MTNRFLKVGFAFLLGMIVCCGVLGFISLKGITFEEKPVEASDRTGDRQGDDHPGRPDARHYRRRHEGLSAKEISRREQEELDTPPRFLVSTFWLSKKLQDGNVVVVHVGSDPEKFAEAHIPMARFLLASSLMDEQGGVPNEMPSVETLQEVFRQIGLTNRSLVVLYSDDEGLSAARAWMTLDYLGHGARSFLLDGGMERWHAELRRFNSSPTQFAPGDFVAQPRQEVLADLAWVQAHKDLPGVKLLDARSPEEYSGAEPGKSIERGGHIPGALSLPNDRLNFDAHVPEFLQKHDLQSLFSEIGVQPGDTVVTYCRTGRSASILYFVSRMLGYQTRLYDGSFSEWSDSSLPVATAPAPPTHTPVPKASEGSDDEEGEEGEKLGEREP